MGAKQTYIDTIIVQTILLDGPITKTAQSGIVSSIMSAVKNYVGDHINPNDKLGSILNILAPGILWALGFPVLAFIGEVAISWFGLDLGKIFGSIASGLKSMITSRIKTSATTNSLQKIAQEAQPVITSEEVDAIVNRAISDNLGAEPTQSDYEAAQHKKITSMTLTEAKLYKTAIVELMSRKNITKQAGLLSFIGLKSTTTKALVKIIGWIVTAVLVAGGFMVADDVAHKVLDGTTPAQRSGREPTTESIATNYSTQTTFKPNPNYSEEKLNLSDRWIEPVPPDKIPDEIVQWAQDIYPDLKNMDSDIKNTAGFKKVVNIIDNYNKTNTSDITFIPKVFTSRKKVVDYFIDELAEKHPQPSKSQFLPNVPPTQAPPSHPNI